MFHVKMFHVEQIITLRSLGKMGIGDFALYDAISRALVIEDSGTW